VIAAACTHSTSADQAPTTSTTSNAPTVTDTPSGSSNPAQQWRLARRKITNVVFLVKENRTFDTFFGTFPGADGFPTDADGNISVCVPDPLNGGCIAPYHDRRDLNGGGPHGHVDAVGDVNGGAMNGFVDRFENAIRLGNTGCKDPNQPACIVGARAAVCTSVRKAHFWAA